MKIRDFFLERYFAKYEFSTKYLLSSSDCEAILMNDLLKMASPEVQEIWGNLSLGYTESNGHPLLREKISSLYDSTSLEDCFICAPAEAIFLISNALLDVGDEVIVTTPAYQSLYELANSLNCQVKKWNLLDKENKWELDLDYLKTQVNSKTKLIVVNFPHNPTGFLPSREEFNEIINIARKHNCYVLCDEMYRFLEYQEDNRLPAMVDVYEKGISLSGLSKAYGLPGLRIGWLALKDQAVLGKVKALKDYTTICNSAPSEVLAMIALDNSKELNQRCLDIIQDNNMFLKKSLGKFKDIIEYKPMIAGPIGFHKFKIDFDFFKFIETTNTMLVGGEQFEMDNNYFRLGVGRLNFKEALNQLILYLSR